MKKLYFVAVMAIAAATMTSCGSSTPKASMNNDVDTVSYAAGIVLSNNFNQYHVFDQQLGLDSAYMNDFIRGINEALSAADSKKQEAYLAGLQIGQQITKQIVPSMSRDFFGDDSTKVVSAKNVVAAFISGLRGGKDALMTNEEADSIQNVFTERQREIAEAKRQAELEARYIEEFGDNKAAGEQFLAENKEKEGVVTTASGLQYKVITMGDGKVPTANDQVKVEYEGRLIDGTVFDSSAQHGDEPATFGVGQVIKGWTEALQLMPVGSEWEVYIPQNLAYGAQNMGTIKPFSALIFKVKLIEVVE